MATNFYTILGVKKSATDAEIKSAYRALALKYHPDHNHSKAAEEKFKTIAEAYNVLSDSVKRNRYDTSGSADPVIIASRKNQYALEEVAVVGDIADVYHSGSNAVKIVRSSSDNDILQNEAIVLKGLFSKDSKVTHRKYFPELIESFKINSNGVRAVNVLKWLDGAYSLAHVRGMYPQGVRFEHGVWMLNRTLEALDYLHEAKKMVHGAVVPQHLMVYPKQHGATLLGLGASVPVGQTIKIASPAYRSFYPPEVFAKKPATPATDIYMAVKCTIFALGGDPTNDLLPDTVPSYLTNFLVGCIFSNQSRRPQNAWELHEELKETMDKHYGPKKFIPFEVP